MQVVCESCARCERCRKMQNGAERASEREASERERTDLAGEAWRFWFASDLLFTPKFDSGFNMRYLLCFLMRL